MEDKLNYLIRYLLDEREENLPYENFSYAEKEKLYKSLVNVRMPYPIDKEYIKVENEYLQAKLKEKGIVDISDIKETQYHNIKNAKNILVWQGDITRLKVDAIVNPANSQGLGCFNPTHNCLDNVIHVSAGIELRLECNKIMKVKDYNLKTSEVIITKGYNLPSKNVIHTVGPIIDGCVSEKQNLELKMCYINCLESAKQNHIKTIAFPCISTGLFKFPSSLASQIAIESVDEYLSKNRNYFDKIIFVTFTNEDYKIYKSNI